MGSTMKKANVIYGEAHSQKLTTWNNWDELERVIREKIGSTARIDFKEAKSQLGLAQKNSKMRNAYLKAGVIGSDLVLRMKAKQFLGDSEYDATLVKNYTALVKKYAGSEDQVLDKGRQIIEDQKQQDYEKLKAASTQQEAHRVLTALGAKRTDLDALITDDAIIGLMKRLGIPQDVFANPNSQGLLLNDRGQAIAQLQFANDRRSAYQYLGRAGATVPKLKALHSEQDVVKLFKELGVPDGLAKRIQSKPFFLSDRGLGMLVLENAKTANEVYKGLLLIGMSRPFVREIFEGLGASIDAISRDLQQGGIEVRLADQLAGIVVDGLPDDLQLIGRLKDLDEANPIRKILDRVGLSSWQQVVSDGGGADIDGAAKELETTLGLEATEARRITALLMP